jgi:hypothetical protein
MLVFFHEILQPQMAIHLVYIFNVIINIIKFDAQAVVVPEKQRRFFKSVLGCVVFLAWLMLERETDENCSN